MVSSCNGVAAVLGERESVLLPMHPQTPNKVIDFAVVATECEEASCTVVARQLGQTADDDEGEAERRQGEASDPNGCGFVI